MAESKSTWFALSIKAHSEKTRRLDLNGYKKLADISERRIDVRASRYEAPPPSCRSGAGFRPLASLPRRSGLPGAVVAGKKADAVAINVPKSRIAPFRFRANAPAARKVDSCLAGKR